MTLASIQSSQKGRTARQHGAMEFSDAPVDLDKVRGYRLQRLRTKMAEFEVAGLLLFNQINTRYAVDATNMQIWCSHYETRCVFVALDGPVVLFDFSNYPHLAEGIPTIDEYRVLPAFYFFGAGNRGQEFVKDFAVQIADLMKNHGGGNRRLAVDSLSHTGCDALRSKGLTLVEGEQITETARAVKSKEELILMQASMDVCEAGIRSMHEALEPGISENALWAKLHETNIRLGGEWIETRLLSSGPRTNPWFRECSMRPLEKGDMVSFDTDLIGPYGYCSDISRAWVCGDKPTEEQHRLYANAFEQIVHNISVLKAGMSFREVSEKCWPIPDEFLSHRYSTLIHGVGLADEYPNIKHWNDFEAKGYDGLIEPGMVLCVESFIGTDEGREGVKLEEQVVVTETGVERQSSYPFETEML
ncbi:MAG: aminopeptidase P family protein [SAR324 cluster bacterium]|nr:aminopeptidase P family protein [SAR324 cluster bacterium]